MDVELTKEELVSRFSIIDYAVFGTMLAASAGIGIFYGCFGKKMKNTSEFLMAGKSMSTFPVAMSLIASFTSAATLLGMPTEVYLHGFKFWIVIFSYIFTMPITAFLYFPVYWNAQVTSAYQYLELRFNRPIRLFAASLYIIQMSLYMGVAVYAPSLALSQVTGIDVNLSVFLLCSVCIFYTTLGGMKAVLWTDTLQVAIMFLAMIFIIMKGFIEEGGFMAVWEANARGNRTLLFDWDLNPTKRNTFWSCLIGNHFAMMLIYGTNQVQVQRYLCVKKKYMAYRAISINFVGHAAMVMLCVFTGLMLYSKYETCDPLKSGIVSRADQLLPLYVMDTLGSWKGIPGLFVAGIFSGALSSISSGMNSLAAVTLEDFLRGILFPKMSEKTATTLSKLLSVFFGLLTLGLVFVVENLGNVYSAAVSIFGIIGGPVCGLFSLGMFFPWANSKGAFSGTLIGLALTLWIGVGFNINVFNGNIVPTSLPTNTYGCPNFNQTFDEHTVVNTLSHGEVEENPLMNLYQLSYLWYACLGFFSSMISGLFISFLTGFTDVKTINPDLISPLIHWIKPILPGGDLIGIEYNPRPMHDLEESKHPPSPGHDNLAFSDRTTKLTNGRIEQEKEVSRL